MGEGATFKSTIHRHEKATLGAFNLIQHLANIVYTRSVPALDVDLKSPSALRSIQSGEMTVVGLIRRANGNGLT